MRDRQPQQPGAVSMVTKTLSYAAVPTCKRASLSDTVPMCASPGFHRLSVDGPASGRPLYMPALVAMRFTPAKRQRYAKARCPGKKRSINTDTQPSKSARVRPCFFSLS